MMYSYSSFIDNLGSCTVNFVSQTDMTMVFSSVTGQGGEEGAMGAMKKKKKEAPGVKEREKQQSLFVNQKFNCTGTLTQWIFAAKWENNDNRDRYPQLEVWRAQGAGSSIYNRIHSTTVSASSQSNNRIYFLTLENPLAVMSGDVLSVYQPEKKKSKMVVYFYEKDLESAQYYYKDKLRESLSQIDTDDEDIKSRREFPLVSAVIGSMH